MTNEEIQRLAAQADTAQGEAMGDPFAYLKSKGASVNDTVKKNVNNLNSYVRDAIVAKQLQANVQGLATGSSQMARPTSFTEMDLINRNVPLIANANTAMNAYGRMSAAGLDAAQQQGDLGAMLKTRAMGQGPSVAGLQGAAQSDAMARSMAGAGTGLAAQRAMMSSAAPAVVAGASQMADARGAEQAQAQQAMAANLAAMRGQSLQGMGTSTGVGLGYQGVNDRATFANASMEMQANAANQQAEEAMRQRQYREFMRQLGDKQAKQAQAMQRTGSLVGTAASVGQQLGTAIADNVAAGKKEKK